MIEVKVINKIGDKIEEYIERTGTTKTWIAKQMGVSRQSIDILSKTPNPTIASIEKVAYVLKCDSKDLYSVEIITAQTK